MNLSMPVVLAGIVGLLLILPIAVFFLRRRTDKKKHSFQTTFPSPPENKEAWQKYVGDLILLGFRFRESFNKLLYGLWQSPIDLYVHEIFDAYAELAYFPSGKIQLQFVTLFPKGSIITLVGERAGAVNLFSPSDHLSWEAGNLVAVWDRHMRRVEAYQEESKSKPVTAESEAYHDFINLFKSHLHERLASGPFTPKTLDDFLILGFAYLDMFRERESMAMFEDAISLQSVNPYLYRAAGKAALYFSNLPKAQNFFQKAFDFNPKDRESVFLLINILLKTKQDKLAFEYLKKVRERFENDPTVTLQMGLLSLRFGKLQDAQTYLEEINDAKMASAVLFSALSELYRRLGDAKQSKKYRRLSSVFSRRKSYWEDLDWAKDDWKPTKR